MGVVREVVRSGPLLMGAGKDMADIKSIRKTSGEIKMKSRFAEVVEEKLV
jgi:hypothetical protein